MALTKQLNSKSNIKQYSSADLPVVPRQPVINRYSVDSTANQTVINLPFSIDTINAPEVLLLSVDGKLLTSGSTNDYTFTAIDGFGFSSQITLTQSISAGLNIQAIKLGLKKETEFVQDQRFNDVYSSLNEGFQGFVATSSLMSATTTTGTPASGQFYSSIVNRAAMVDMRSDLKPRMGIDRMPVQQIYQLQNEFGPNGEPVFAAVNDTLGMIRYVGSGWINITDNNGSFPNTSSANDYAEITFYGTGLNVMMVGLEGGRDIRQTTDGGTESGNLISNSATQSAILQTKKYAPNVILPVVSNLSLGVHTVKLRLGTAVSSSFMGFEILNEASTILVQPGTSYIQGKKLSSQSTQNLPYNTTFESGAIGARGGRVVIYQKADGSIAKAVQPVDASQANLALADHTNEEVARTYHFREFGAGRADDFSTGTLPTSAAFTLDDGTTNLVSSGSNDYVTLPDYLYIGASGNFITITFIGTGLDLNIKAGTGATIDTHAVTVDGVSIGNIQPTTSQIKTQKIVSGLPYGTHTVKITRNASTANSGIGISQFIVYQPKKPTVPSGAVELADYSVMATYSPGTATSIGSGVLRKNSIRELTYVNGTGGTSDWSLTLAPATDTTTGFTNNTDRQNAYVEYTFFGTGFEFRGESASNRSANIQVSLQALSINGALSNLTTTNFPGIATGAYGTGIAFNATTGIFDLQDAANVGEVGFYVSGLTLGLYKVRLLNNTASSFISVNCFDIITPIHSYDPNIPYNQQNTLLIGSQGIMDTRKTTAVKESNLQVKNMSQAFGVISNPTTSSSSHVPCPDMSLTLKTSGGAVEITFHGVFYTNAANTNVGAQIYVNGTAVGRQTAGQTVIASNTIFNITNSVFVALPVGVHKIDAYWVAGGGSTATAHSTYRILKAREV